MSFMKYLRRIVQVLHPEELIAAPFLLFLVLFAAFSSFSIRFQPGLVHWLAILALLYIGIFLCATALRLFREHRKGIYLQHSFICDIFQVFRDWLPLIAIFIVYENLHDIVPLLAGSDQDAALNAIDRALFGPIPWSVLLQKIVSPWLTDIMYLSYSTLFLYIPVLAGIFHFTRQQKAWRILLLALTRTAFTGFLLYLAVPAVGPGYYLAASYNVDLNGAWISEQVAPIFDTFRISRDVFPSLHVALSAVCLFVAWQYHKPSFYLFLPFVVGLWISTIYLRYHYTIDIFAGLALAYGTVFLSKKISERHE